MTDTDSGKRLSDAEIVANFLTLEEFLGSVDGHDLTDWATDENGNQVGADNGTVDADEAFKAMNALRAHITTLTANRGSVSEEAIDAVAIAIAKADKELGREDAQVEEWLGYIFIARAAISAIQQAVSECSGGSISRAQYRDAVIDECLAVMAQTDTLGRAESDVRSMKGKPPSFGRDLGSQGQLRESLADVLRACSQFIERFDRNSPLHEKINGAFVLLADNNLWNGPTGTCNED